MNELTKYQLLLFIVIMFSVRKIAATRDDKQSKTKNKLTHSLAGIDTNKYSHTDKQ